MKLAELHVPALLTPDGPGPVRWRQIPGRQAAQHLLAIPEPANEKVRHVKRGSIFSCKTIRIRSMYTETEYP